jgi:hypothetical protein
MAADPMRDAEPIPPWYVLFSRKPFIAIVVAHFCHNWYVESDDVVAVMCQGAGLSF